MKRLALLFALTWPVFAAIVVGPEIEVTQRVLQPPAFVQEQARMANELVVWTERAQFSLAIHGRLGDTPLVIADTAGREMEPDVAWDGSRYLVTWLVEGSGNFGRFVETDGAMSEPFRISNGFSRPRVVSNTRVFLVVWTDDRLRGAIVDGSGRVSEAVDIGETPADFAAVNANGALFAVAMRNSEIAIVNISAEGRLAGRFTVSTSGETTALRTASRPNGALIAWMSGTYVEYVGLTALGTGPVRTFPGEGAHLDAVIDEGEEFLLVYGNRVHRPSTGATSVIVLPANGRVVAGFGEMLVVSIGDDLYLQRIDSAEREPLVLAATHQSGPDIAASGAIRLVAWAELMDDGQRLGIAAARLGIDTTSIDLGADLRGGVLPVVRVAGGNGQWLVAWQHGSAISGVRVAADGRVLNAAPFTIAEQIYLSDPFSVTWDGAAYVVVFQRGVSSRTGGSFAIMAARVTAGGLVESPEIEIVSSGPNIGPAAAAGPDGVLVVWTHRDVLSLVFTLRGALVSRSGTVTPIAFPAPYRIAGSPAVAWNNGTFLVGTTYGELHFFLVSAAGVVTPASAGATVPLGPTQTPQQLSPFGDGFLLTWASEGTIYAATINRSGYVADRPVAVATIALNERNVGVSGSTIVYARPVDPLRDRITRVFAREISVTTNPPKRRAVR